MAGMEVANPIYDVVFKYLMQNQRVARWRRNELERLLAIFRPGAGEGQRS